MMSSSCLIYERKVFEQYAVRKFPKKKNEKTFARIKSISSCINIFDIYRHVPIVVYCTAIKYTKINNFYSTEHDIMRTKTD